MKTLLCLLPLVAFSLCASPALYAQTVVDLTPTADAYVDQANPGSFYGTNTNLSVRGTTGGDNNRYIYLQFDLSTITEPITDATLTFTVSFGVANRTASTLQLYGLAYDTAEEALALGLETTLTNTTAPWAAVRPAQFTAPANATGLLSTAAIPASGSFSGGSTVTFVSTSELVSLLETARTGPNSIVTLVLIENTGQQNPLTFASSEHGTYAGPTLTITSQIPEPATAATLFGFAVLALAAVQRSSRRG